METTSGGSIWVSAPVGTCPPTTGGVSGVYVNPGEMVEWVWTHGTHGSYVSGYIIKGLPVIQTSPETQGDTA